jgi:hypothetical protein
VFAPSCGTAHRLNVCYFSDPTVSCPAVSEHYDSASSIIYFSNYPKPKKRALDDAYMVSTKAGSKEEAVSELVGTMTTRKYSVGNIEPVDTEAYFEGEDEQVYQINVTLFEPKERKIVRVDFSKEGGKWKAEALTHL